MSDLPPPDPARWRSLAVCLAASSMTLLDLSIVNVALPTLQSSLGAGDSELQWIVAGYALAFGMVLVPAGRLGDARSRRTVFLVGVALFTVSSALAGAAPSAVVLSLARVLQGIGGGLIIPQTSGSIQNLFQGPERARAFGLLGAAIGVSTAIGPLVGGLLVNLGGEDLGWRLVFYVNLPIGLVLLPLAYRLLPAAKPARESQSLDPVGVVLFAGAVLLILLPLVEGDQDRPLTERPWWLLVPAALLLVGCLLWERSWARRGRETLIDLPLFRVRSYVLGLCLGTCYFAGFTGVFLVITLYLQVGLGYSALEAGATGTPFAVGSAVASVLGGRWLARFDRKVAVLGLTLVIVGLVAVDLLTPTLDGMVGLKLAPLLLLAGFGGGLVISPNVTLTLTEVDPQRAGSGGGMLQTAQRVGGAIGVAVVLAQFFAALGTSRGDYDAALSISLRTTIALIAAALVFAVIDLARRRTAEDRASPYLPHARAGKP